MRETASLWKNRYDFHINEYFIVGQRILCIYDEKVQLCLDTKNFLLKLLEADSTQFFQFLFN